MSPHIIRTNCVRILMGVLVLLPAIAEAQSFSRGSSSGGSSRQATPRPSFGRSSPSFSGGRSSPSFGQSYSRGSIPSYSRSARPNIEAPRISPPSNQIQRNYSGPSGGSPSVSAPRSYSPPKFSSPPAPKSNTTRSERPTITPRQPSPPTYRAPDTTTYGSSSRSPSVSRPPSGGSDRTRSSDVSRSFNPTQPSTQRPSGISTPRSTSGNQPSTPAVRSPSKGGTSVQRPQPSVQPQAKPNPTPAQRTSPSITRSPSASVNRSGDRSVNPAPSATPSKSQSLSRSATPNANPSISRSTAPTARSITGQSSPSLQRPATTTPRSALSHTSRGNISTLRQIGTVSPGSSGLGTSSRSMVAPRLGVAGYRSTFTRYAPVVHRPNYWQHRGYWGSFHRPFYHRHHHHRHFSFGFGFYSSCYAYPAYPLGYYPSYYYPLYTAAVVPTTVVVEQPVVTYYPAATVVAPVQYASADAYVSGANTVPAPEVSYATPQPEPQVLAPEGYVQSDAPQTQAPEAAVEHYAPQTGPPSNGAPSYETQEAPSADEPSSDVQVMTQAPPGESDEDAPALAMPPEKLQQLMIDGTQAFGEGKYEQAADAFDQVRTVDAQNVDAALACGVAQFAAGRYDASAEAIYQGVSLFPPIVDSLFDLRERYKNRSDFAEQLRKLQEFAQQHPKNVDAQVVLGFVLHFSNQRDEARQVFEGIKKFSPEDGPLADIFLDATSPEAAGLNEAETQPASSNVASQPAGLDAIRGGPADAGVLSVSTRPANIQTVELPADPLFKGRMSLQGELPREQAVLDGIVVRLKGTDDDPPKASMEILAGDKRLKVSNFQPGARVQLQGESGQVYRLVLTEVNNQTETVSYMVAKEPTEDAG